MSAGHRTGVIPPAVKAAKLVLAGELNATAAAERFGVRRTAVYQAVMRLKREAAAREGSP